jgi:26S proteasome regulatory subunit N10
MFFFSLLFLFLSHVLAEIPLKPRLLCNTRAAHMRSRPLFLFRGRRSSEGLNVFALALAISSCAFINAVGGAEQEATLIAVDNSGYMINSDHRPSRLQCQYECVNLVCTVKTQQPENTVGLLTMGCQSDDDQPEIHVTPGTNQQLGPILIAMSKVNKQIGGAGANRVRFKKSMELAYLSLKHRIHKHQRPRIVAFVGSPIIGEDMREIVKCAKTLRKNNVAVDLISFGESPRVNKEILEAFMQGVNKDGTSHLLSLPAEACTAGGLSDALFSSPILNHAPPPGTAPESGERGPGVGGGREAHVGAFAEFGGINPDLDPELAMALKMSAQVSLSCISSAFAFLFSVFWPLSSLAGRWSFSGHPSSPLFWYS